jgi:poly-gamma-glutamate capsule biosynthesis protein CapA/YwtB (metallophosphatase superfamily)
MKPILLLSAASLLLAGLAQAVCEPQIRLLADSDGANLDLRWKPHWTQTAWRIETALDADFTQPQEVAVTHAPFHRWTLLAGDPGPRFFRVVAVDGPALGDSTMVEDFEFPVYEPGSWAGEDLEPEGWAIDRETVFEGQASLRLFGNTVKSQALGGPVLGLDGAFRVAARCGDVADRQMVGFADSLNVLWYVLWGSRGGYPDTPGQSGQVEVSTYQGWFPLDEWVRALLPVGRDWISKYGYAPALCEVLWANESDDNTGVVWFDALEEVTALAMRRPLLQPEAELLGAPGDSLEWRLATTPVEPGVAYRWQLGDGRWVGGAEATVRLLAERRHTVVLEAQDGDGAWSLASLTLDGPAEPRRLRLGFVGDVMTARAYESPGGIIETLGVDAIFDSVRAVMQGVDLMEVNLECPYTLSADRHPTKTIVFKSRPENLAGVVGAGVDFVSLANNHVFDYMIEGMLETFAVVEEAGLVHAGSGLDARRAMRPAWLSHDGLAVGHLALSDRTGNYNNYQPFLDAGASRPGFALWDRGAMQALVPEVAAHADLTVLQVHSGNEYSTQPSLVLAAPPAVPRHEDHGSLPWQDGLALALDEGLPFNPELQPLGSRELLPDQSERSLRREAVDLGAQLVIAHHPHIVQGFEVYNGGLIAHSLGNFVMDLSYIETMPSVLLEVEAEEGELREALVRPVFIDAYLPRLARGEVAQGLLGHMTRLSRPFGTWLLRDPGQETGRIVLDTLAVALDHELQVHELPLEARGDWWISAPTRLVEEGCLTGIEQLSFVTGAEIRLGRNQCWWGDMEDGGASIWDINSAHEGFSEVVAMRGARSLELSEDGGQTVYTYYIGRAPLDTEAAWTLAGFVRTQNAASAGLQIRYYTTRNGGLLSAESLPTLSGTQDWSLSWMDLAVPATGRFHQLRLGLTAGAGGGQAWFDDVRLIEWEAWGTLPLAGLVELGFPTDCDWVQVRLPQAAASLELRSRRSWDGAR